MFIRYRLRILSQLYLNTCLETRLEHARQPVFQALTIGRSRLSRNGSLPKLTVVEVSRTCYSTLAEFFHLYAQPSITALFGPRIILSRTL